MAWNEPGGNGGRDPWGGRQNDQGPPDLDEVVRKLQAKLGGLFGGRKGGGGNVSPMGGGKPSVGIGLILAVLVVAWILSGIYIVDPAERAVVTRFGKYHTTVIPGPHWRARFIDDYEKVNVDLVRNAEVGFRSNGRSQGSVPREALMLTKDENIIDIKFAVQYRVKDAKDYLFNIVSPDITLRDATESAVREIIGKSDMDYVITGGRGDVAEKVESLVQVILDRYGTGLEVTSVNMQDAQPPKEVQGAFDDAVKAREDEERLKNEAEAYANDILPKARGESDAMRERAEGYKQRVTALADGEASRFLDVLKVYQQAPEVTRERMYIESVESVLSNSSKVIMDVKDGNSLMYLPVDQLMKQRPSAIQPAASDNFENPTGSPGSESVSQGRQRSTRSR